VDSRRVRLGVERLSLGLGLGRALPVARRVGLGVERGRKGVALNVVVVARLGLSVAGGDVDRVALDGGVLLLVRL
jgi:hypothetical protein